MVLRLAIACLLPTTALGACLVNATAPETRKNLVNPVTGEEYPVGVWVAQWAAGYATSYVMGILIEEMLGFNVTYSEGPGTVEGYYAITGCTTPLNTTDRGCGPNGPNVSYQHIQAEAWMGGYEDIWRLVTMMENHPRVAASMGYSGKIAQYFPRGVLEAAYADAGLALDFYTGFDADWNDPASYFDPVSNVNRSHLKKCADSLMNSPDLIAQYFAVSGDTAGLTTNAAGEQVGYCPDGYFWISPKCRADQSKCIPYFTGGQGYGIVEVMQKAAKWNIPLALGVGATYALYTQLPSMHKSMFYWWVPDPTFLHLEALPSTFPATDKIAIAKGDQTTEMASIIIAKLVSKDFSALAPRVNSFVDRVTIKMDNLNALLLEQSQTGVDWPTMACYWLQNNTDLWSDWLPDDSTCFSKFGMYRASTEEFVDNRDGSTDGITCLPCPSGTYSKQLSDDKGVTYICEPCAPGTSQVSGASLSCVPCERGMFQDVPGQLLCKRCGVGSYQDEEGGPVCKKCPENSRTLQQGSLTIFDCGCEENYIDVAEGAAKTAGNLSCIACQEGLYCPVMGTLESLESGSHPRGADHLPAVLEGHFVTAAEPLEVYKCGKITQCPGGQPAQCSGGLVGVPCAECPEGSTMDDNSCDECKPELQVLWFLGVAVVFAFLTAAYYLMTSKVTAKASVLFTTTCAFGMLISLLQSIGIIGTMTVEFPVDVKGLFSWMSIFLLELDNFGFSCLAGSSTPPRYMVSVLFFPLGIAWFALNWGVSQLVPKYRWDLIKTFACMGQFLQVGFSTMSAIALAPLTCYTHPNQQQSLLKYPNVICGSTDHSIMLVGGILLLSVGVLGFLCLCTYAAVKVPEWSAMEKHSRVRAFRFLVFRFRLDSWWFGVPLLTRGPLIALPIVLATDYPAIQSVWVTFILLCFLACQALAWPWKVPLLNALDCWMSYCIMILVAGSALYLEPINKVGVVAQFVDNFTTGIMVYKSGKITQCPGGLPAQCSGGLVDVPCAQCPEGSTMDNNSCEACKPELQVLWFVGVGAVFLLLTAAYYLMTSKVTAKASVLFTTTCAFGMLISLLQSIGIIGTMTVEFPVDVKGIFSWMSIFVLELDNFGFACLAGSATPPRYMVSVLFFPLGLAWFALNYGVSQLVPKYRWDLTKTFACMGQFLQVGFSTMSAIALAPLTCYTHPNQQQSLLKYPNVICGSTDHSIMLVGGVLLLCVGVLGFLCLCSYAALKVPEWSAMEKHARVRAFRFLVFRFRLDSWWFGVPLLTRGPLIALPIVLATDYPAIQSVWVTFILLCFLACQALAWPWKVPLLNALDCWMSYCIMILVAGSALYLEPINKVGIVADFVDNFTTGVMVVIFGSIGSMVLMALCALTHRAAMGGSSEFAVFNLGRTPKPDVVAQKLKEMGELLGQMDVQDVEKAFDTLAVFDTRRITTFMTMMSAEVLMERADLSYGKRVTSQSFSGAPKPQRDSTGSIIRSTTTSRSTRSRDSKNSTQAATV